MNADTTEIAADEKWLNVANGALREVGAEPMWVLGKYGPWLPNFGTSRDHYRSAILAHLAVGTPSQPERRTAPGHVVCWPCWESGTAPSCAEVPTEQALRFQECTR